MDHETKADGPDVATRRDAVGSDLDEATSFYAALHNAHRVTLTPATRAFSYRLRTVGDADMTLRSSTLSADRWGLIEPEGRYLLTWAQQGTAVIDAGTDEEQLLHPGTAAMYPTGRAFTLEVAVTGPVPVRASAQDLAALVDVLLDNVFTHWG